MITEEKMKINSSIEVDTAQSFSQECWLYIKTVVEIVREPVLVLDKNLRVMVANETFYKMFQVDQKDTEGQVVYKLGNGQWNIPALRKLLEEILPQNTFFKGFEMSHTFPVIGRKTMVLNARQIHTVKSGNVPLLPSIIFLAIEDITAIIAVAETLASHVKELATQSTLRTQKLELYVKKLEKEIKTQKKGSK